MNKITAIMTIFNGDEYLECSLNSLISLCDSIVVIEGCVKGNEHSGGIHSTDGTLEILKKYKDKIILIQQDKVWESKSSMLNVGLKYVQDGYILLASDDEVYHEKNIPEIQQLIQSDKYDVIYMKHIHFWKTYNKYISGADWSVVHMRLCRYVKDCKFVSIETLVGKDGKNLYQNNDNCKKIILSDDIRIYHYGWVKKSESVINKIVYYMKRDPKKYKKVSINVLKDCVKRGHGFFIGLDPKIHQLNDFNIQGHPENIKQLECYQEFVEKKNA